MSEITLNEQEQRIARYIAKERMTINRASNKKTSIIGSQSNEEVDLEGIAGEIAFCKIFNLYPDFKTNLVNQDSDEGDCVYKEFKVDVKTTTYKSGKLICGTWKNDKVDYYALMTGTFPTYEFKGFAKGSVLKTNANLINLGRGECYGLTQDKLIKEI